MRRRIITDNLIFLSVCMLFQQNLYGQVSLNKIDINIGSNSYNCRVTDINHDGKPDIYIVNFNKKDKVYINTGNGSFESSEQEIGNSIKFNRNIGIADLNSDSYPDLFIPNDANWNSASVSIGLPNEIWYNDGTGKFTDSGQRLGNSASNDVALADMDNDGDIDAVVANFHTTDLESLTYQSNSLWLNDGAGNFSKSDEDLGMGSNHVQLADIDADSDPDIVFSSPDNGVLIYLNNGNASFTFIENLIGNCSAFDIGDADNDGDVDIVKTNAIRDSNAPVQLWLNNGNGVFENSNIDFGNINGSDIICYDFDLDGDQDIFASDGIWKSNKPHLWINQGNFQSGVVGTFESMSIAAGNFQMGNISTGNIAGNSKPGIVISNFAGDNMIFEIDNITGINHFNFVKKYKLYPNPASKKLIIELLDNNVSETSIYMFDSRGRLVHSSSFSTNTFYLDISAFPKGYYLLTIKKQAGFKCTETIVL